MVKTYTCIGLFNDMIYLGLIQRIRKARIQFLQLIRCSITIKLHIRRVRDKKDLLPTIVCAVLSSQILQLHQLIHARTKKRESNLAKWDYLSSRDPLLSLSFLFLFFLPVLLIINPIPKMTVLDNFIFVVCLV